MPTELREGPWPFGNLIEGDIFSAHVNSTQDVRCPRVTFYPASVLFSRYREGASDGIVSFFHAAPVSNQTGNDSVILSDSDDDVEDNVYLPSDVMTLVEDNIQDIIESTMNKYDVDFQLTKGDKILEKRVAKLEQKTTEVDENFNDIQKSLDETMRLLYNDFAPLIKELPPITIVDDGVLPINDLTSHQTATLMKYGSPKSAKKHFSPDDGRRPLGVAMKKVTQVRQCLLGNNTSETTVSDAEGNIVQEITVPDVVALEQVDVTHKPLPPIGPIPRPTPQPGDIVYVMKLSFYGLWSRAKIIEILPKGTKENNVSSEYISDMFKVKFESTYRKSNPVKVVQGKQMAYPTPCPMRYHVGTRVIAIFSEDERSKESFYAGVIAEPPKSMNKFRYLVFFDDGYAQYISHEKILLVCESSKQVWEDIHPDSRDFVRKYLEQYPERPMVKLQQGQIVKTEWSGKWWIARVVEVDGSMVKMHFDADNRSEWIYRGSTRLGPLFAELAKGAYRKEQGTFRHRGLGIASLKKRNMPYVEYTRNTDTEDTKTSESAPVRSVARKSTTRLPDYYQENIPNQSALSQERLSQVGKVEEVIITTKAKPRSFTRHQCSPRCLTENTFDLKNFRGVNPLWIPIICGWRREIIHFRTKRVIVYRTPCGRRLRRMDELHRYLNVTRAHLGVDLFDFDHWVHIAAEYTLINPGFIKIKDLSYGIENVPVPCVNSIDHTVPDYVPYSTVRQPTAGVFLNTDQEFLTGCNCEDDCNDRSKCSCWQLTIQGTGYGSSGVVDTTIGYNYKRLPEPVITGIYECNSRCKCSTTCMNRVAQQPLQLRLQVFKTENRGWGIRTLHDIPQGTFICIYAGHLLTDQEANEGGKNYGDEYLAELNYIEAVERMKEGYESDILEDDDGDAEEKQVNQGHSKPTKELETGSGKESSGESEEENSQDTRGMDSDEEFRPNWVKKKVASNAGSSINTRLRERTSRHSSNDSEGKEKKVKKVITKVEKQVLQHSTSEDVIVLSDEEDTDIVRKPSKFAVTEEPKKGTELTWDYSYDIGSVPGKVLHCHCGSTECRGRLL
uniref:Histone-lysine N-methyltransferase eggless n=1 Tax=Timema cristinae TaxID=61476 RepID=A0A7R9CBH3_TIMCR|nr:unnamed protein product [Timema cristinae]